FAGLFGADIGPNLTIVGSLATLIWMTQVRRAGLAVSGWTYLRLGALTTIPALVAAMVLLAAVSALLS
ncbi:MAG TPA: ArsB/NhaD family transporter, partial [Thermomicrobiales bacterium]|nr:ArsB/NhaD family transporter [Thermomicrobiales bacterium]